MTYPLPSAPLSSAPIQADAMTRLGELITTHIQDKRYPGAQIALAHNGKLVWEQSFGHARVGQGHDVDTKAVVADNHSLWLLYSNTKIIMATLLWKLHEQGKLRFTDRVADHLPEFAKMAKMRSHCFKSLRTKVVFQTVMCPALLGKTTKKCVKPSATSVCSGSLVHASAITDSAHIGCWRCWWRPSQAKISETSSALKC